MTAGARAAADIGDQPDVLSGIVSHNAGVLGEARRLVRDHALVRLLGLGSSKHAAGYGAHALELFADTPATVLPAPGSAVTLPRLRPDHPLVVLSQSGRTPALLDVARRACDDGVDVVAITNEPGSPLEELASVTLACRAGAERVVAATKSVTAQMLLVRTLASALSESDVEALTIAVREALALDITPVVHGDPPSAVVCAGFAAEWIADEIALKFAEMSGLPITSESVVEHFHGPRAAGARTLAFLDPNDLNSTELAAAPHVTTAGPHASFDLTTPTAGEASLDAIVNVVVGQRIVHAWALALGEDPDADRGLSKVTATR